MRVIRWTLILVFILSTTVAVIVRSTGYTGVESDQGKYYVTFKSMRYEVSEQQQQEIYRRDRISWTAALLMISSMLALGGM